MAEHRSDTWFSLAELAGHIGAVLKGPGTLRVRGVAALEDARPDQISFVSHPRYARLVPDCRAAALVVDASLEGLERPLLICGDPYLAFARVAQLFAEPLALIPGIHPSAFIGERVQLAADVAVGPLAHIGNGCIVGTGTRLSGSCYLGREVRLGEHCLIYPHATILDGCQLGDRVIIHSGTVIGSDGFGYAHDQDGHHVKIPQMGMVQIDDDVEIGANCTIDRAALGKTWIQQGTKIDNQVQIAHNVVVGAHNLLVAQVGIAGSTKLGNQVVLAGQVGVIGHITIGDRVRVAAKSAVAHSIKDGEDMLGIPAVPIKEWMRTHGHIRRLAQMRDEIKRIKSIVKNLEQALQGNGHE
jgi:UDP-3-O-[3-hydroxymyristoyl] glucosamine N-acyltransferase